MVIVLDAMVDRSGAAVFGESRFLASPVVRGAVQDARIVILALCSDG
jgi:hypothetical protein